MRTLLPGGRAALPPRPHWYARHDERLGGGSPLWRLMAPTTSQRQLLLREEGGKEARGEIATLGTHGAPACWLGAARCAYEAGGLGEPAKYGKARCPSRGRCVDAVGARGRPFVLSGEISTGVLDAPSVWFAGWWWTAVLEGRRSPW